MKKFWLLQVLIVFAILSASAQQCPEEWVEYTRSGYLFDIESARNDGQSSDIEFKNSLLNLVRSNIAKQIEVRIIDKAEHTAVIIDGKTSQGYYQTTNFLTDVEMSLVETRTKFDSSNGRWYAIAFLNKAAARRYYKNSLQAIQTNIDNAITVARNYINTGFRERAKNELNQALTQTSSIDKSTLWLAMLDLPATELSQITDNLNKSIATIKQTLADLQYGNTVCLICTTNLFDSSYPQLQNELKGLISPIGCNFTDQPSQADFIVRIAVTSNEENKVSYGSYSAYFAQVNAVLSITKATTSQVIYETELSVKGSDTNNFVKAAKNGCKQLKEQLAQLIKENIKQ